MPPEWALEGAIVPETPAEALWETKCAHDSSLCVFQAFWATGCSKIGRRGGVEEGVCRRRFSRWRQGVADQVALPVKYGTCLSCNNEFSNETPGRTAEIV